MNNKIFIIYFILQISVLELYSQNSIFEHYGVEDGLQSSEIYSQAQDNSGYMWFATSKGVSRFDGYEFKNYTMKDGLPSNSIIEIYVDYKGRIWFSSFEGALCYFQNEKIYQHELNDTIRKLSKNYFIDNICIDTLDNIWFTPSLGGVYKIEPNNKIYYDFPKIDTDFTFLFKEMSNGYIWSRIPNGNQKPDSLELEFKNNIYYLKISRLTNQSIRRFLQKTSENTFLLSFGNVLLLIKDGQIINQLEYENDISGVFSDKKGNFWISVMYEGIYYYNDGDLNSKAELFLRGKSPISVFQDREGNYWMATTEDGIYFASSFQFNTYNQFGFSEYNILAMENQKNDLYFSTYDKQVFKCNVESNIINYIQNLSLTKKRNYAFLDIVADSEENIWFLGYELLKLNEDKVTIIDTLTRAYSLFANKKSQIFVTTANGFYEFSKDTITKQYFNENISSSNSIFEDYDGTIYLGSLNGLYKMQNDNVEYLGNKFEVLKSRINDIKKINKYLLIATSGEGLVIFKDSVIFQLTRKSDLLSNFVNNIFIDNDSVCWIGTNKGLCKITFNNSNSELSYKIEKFTKSDGLFSEEIKDIVRINDCIWLGTSRGLISFFPDFLKKEIVTPSLLLDSILINDISISDIENQSLKYNQNNISFFFKAISYRATQKIKYKYKLEGFDEQWVETVNRYARFRNLQPGEYIFYITASSEDENWNENPIKIHFVIKKHFTQTIAFVVFVILVSIIVIFLILYFIYNNLRKDIDNKRLLHISEQKALRAQMNPHFIFNSLNSIRRYILENDNDSADNYLTSFASLMRLVLDNSNQNFIPLSTEIETLKRYVELERMRFDNTFVFNLQIDKNMLTNEINIPPMLIQPYLENSIWHGLAPKKSDGILILKLEKTTDNILICTIEDNGIGRENAAEIAKKRKNHTSTGLKNIQERLELINTITNSKTIVEFIDLYDNEKVAAGTKVVIKIPYLAFNKI